MAVPAHDERDREFAEAFDLPIVEVVTEDGVLVNSGDYDGMPADEGGKAIVESLEKEGKAKQAVSYRLRDWSFSRQRYWGAPIPIVYCDDCGLVPLPDDELPLLLPEVEDYRPKGVPPLASNEEWMNVPCPRCGKPGRREADTMDTFVDSAWYFLRYVDPHNDSTPFDRRIVDYWAPVDQYIGGIDHATGHLLYSRFFVKVMNEMGLVGFREPFASVFHQGWVQLGGTKMSKSKGNVEGPDQLVRHARRRRRAPLHPLPGPRRPGHGVDAFRASRASHVSCGACGGSCTRSPTAAATDGAVRHAAGAQGARDDREGDRRHQPAPVVQHRHRGDHGARQRAVRATPSDPAARFAAETAVCLIQPYAPHVAEELWGVLGHERLWEAPWPEADPALLERETFELVIQVNGRVRDRIEAAATLSDDELVELAKGSEKVQAHLDGKEIRQAVVVPRKLVNFVV